jgi:hypothetical protein
MEPRLVSTAALARASSSELKPLGPWESFRTPPPVYRPACQIKVDGEGEVDHWFGEGSDRRLFTGKEDP